MSDMENQVSEENTEGAMANGGYLAADTMKAGDVKAVINELAKSFNDLAAAFKKVYEGSDYGTAEALANSVIAKVGGGLHVTFYQKNSHLSDSEQRTAFLKMQNGAQGPADKQAVLNLYDYLCSAESILQLVSDYFTIILCGKMKAAYSIVRYDLTMNAVYKKVDMSAIISAFQTFGEIHDQLNSASIYSYVRVSRDGNYDENYMNVTNYISKVINNNHYLKDYFGAYNRLTAYGSNLLKILDDYTYMAKLYSSYESDVKEAFNAAEERINAVNAILKGQFGSETEALNDAMLAALDGASSVFFGAGEILENYKTNSSDAPYCLLHYDPSVVSIVNQFGLGSVGDPLSSGTSYYTFFTGMISRFSSLARAIVKAAPRE